MKILKGNNKRIAKVWVDDLSQVESQTLDQIRLMLEMPSLFKHIAIMPDTHLGRGAVIGGVVAIKNTIVPNIVGVDIGCGMSAINTNVKLTKEMDKTFWLNWKSRVNRSIPVGFNSHKEEQDIGALDIELKAKDLMNHMPRAKQQMGTLGGGNHFLEAQVDEDNNIWFMVHSGSRHLGLQIATYYNKTAQNLNEKYHSKTPRDLWFLPLNDEGGQNYLHDMKWAIDFALENRWRMLETIVQVFFDQNKDGMVCTREFGINIHHNFASIENHFGENVIVHRKGATQAKKEQIGIVPGSMGSLSYIVKGVGNLESYESCSHGAGRAMSRSAAKQAFNTNDLHEALKNTFTKASANMLDEAPMAYKSIETVMANQKDLIDIVHILKPVITIKG